MGRCSDALGAVLQALQGRPAGAMAKPRMSDLNRLPTSGLTFTADPF